MSLLEFGKKHDSKGLVCIFHGYGANSNNLRDIGEALAEKMPDQSIIIPNALQKWEGSPHLDAYQWFSLQDYTQPAMQKQLETISPTVVSWLEKRQAERCPDKPLYLLGFSQGAMVALYLTAAGLVKPKALLAYSGLFIPPKVQNASNKTSNILAYHGDEDKVLPLDFSEKSYDLLQNYGLINFQLIKEKGLGHSISQKGFEKGLELIAAQQVS